MSAPAGAAPATARMHEGVLRRQLLWNGGTRMAATAGRGGRLPGEGGRGVDRGGQLYMAAQTCQGNTPTHVHACASGLVAATCGPTGSLKRKVMLRKVRMQQQKRL